MIEIICKDDPQKSDSGSREDTVFLPKNIRQVGSPRGRHRIYLEDYVYTYLRSTAKNNESCAAVFLGRSQVVKDIRYTFVSGVVECGAAVFQWENICLDESFWDFIYKEQKQFFSESEIVGWALGKAGQAMELTPAVEAAHRKYFAGRDKILMLIDILEGEEMFFIYEQGYLQKREGYYIYYEKNLAMQEYMIYKREEEMRLAKLRYSESVTEDVGEDTERLLGEESAQADPSFAERNGKARREVEEDTKQADLFAEEDGEEDIKSSIQTEQWKDARPIPKEPKTQAEEALESYRKMLLERQGKRQERQNRKFLYTASSFFLVVLCVIGITTINNYRKMQKVEDVLNIMNHGKNQPSASDESEVAADKNQSSAEGDLVVETIESQIEPLAPENGKDSQKEEDDAAQDVSKKSEDSGQNASGKPSDEEKEDAQKPSGEAKEDASNKPSGETKGDASNKTSGEAKGDASNKLSGEAKEDASNKPSDEAKEDASGKSSDEAKGDASANSSDEGKQDAQPADNTRQEDSQQTSAGELGQQRYYTVQAGDTLNSICLNIYKTKDMVKVLKEVNGIEDGDKIFVGQKLLLP